MNASAHSALLFAVPCESRGRPIGLCAGENGLEIRLENGEMYFLDWRAIQFQSGGLDGQHIILEGECREGIFLHIQSPGTSFRDWENKMPREIFHQEIAPLIYQTSRNSKRAASWGWIILGSLLSSLVLLILFRGALIDAAVKRIPLSWEKQIGEAAATQFLARSSPLREGDEFQQVQTLFDTLVSAANLEDFAWTLHLVAENEANAFALPGGSIIINQGLLREAESPEEIAGVLAHEIQHVRFRHGLSRIVGNIGFSALLAVFLGDLQGFSAIARETALRLSLSAYDRDQERQADEEAVRLLISANIDPLPFANFFARLDKRQGGMEKTFSYFSTHPPSTERRQEILRLREELAMDRTFLPLQNSLR